MDAPIARNYVNWTLPRAERQFSMLRRAYTRLSSSEKGNGSEKRGNGGRTRSLMDETKRGAESMDGDGEERTRRVPLGRIRVLPFATVTHALHVSIRLSNFEFQVARALGTRAYISSNG